MTNKKCALVVIDCQNDFFTGTLANPAAVAVTNNIINAIKYHKSTNSDIIYTTDTHNSEGYEYTIEGRSIPRHCIYGTDGHNFIPKIVDYIAYNDTIYSKGTFGSYRLANHIRDEKYTDVYLIGVCTDICVIANAFAIQTMTNGKCRIHVYMNCCAGTTYENHQKALDIMKNCCIEIDTLNYNMIHTSSSSDAEK